jgi:hypothetical protein
MELMCIWFLIMNHFFINKSFYHFDDIGELVKE